ncbi:cytochrome ubiquinol oxidase subunit I, partial [Escherichia coli]|nr:cytochrome ubiquinol oxidase subunit I [Escherichia coli]
LSFLAANRFDTVVKGLNAFPRDEWPPLFIHTLFNAMVGVGMLLILYSIIGVVWRKVLKKDRFPTWLLIIFMTAGPFSLIGIEF